MCGVEAAWAVLGAGLCGCRAALPARENTLGSWGGRGKFSAPPGPFLFSRSVEALGPGLRTDLSHFPGTSDI